MSKTDDLPPLNALRAFAAAGRHLTFRAAAGELGVTQGAVAQHVRALEARLELPLFERHPRGLTLTEAGRRYHAQLERAFRILTEATHDLRPGPQRVTISVTPSFAAKWLIPNMADFAAAHPTVDLRVMATETLSRFQADGVDIVVRYGVPPFGAALEDRQLFREGVIPVCSPRLLEQAVDLTGLSLLHDSTDLWPDYIEQVLGMARPKRLSGPRFSTISLALDAAMAGQGVALANRFMVARELASGRLVQAHDGALRTPQGYHALTPRENLKNPAVRAVFEWLSTCASGETQPATHA
ncbi:LysR substrate-binding domain-containing protein [Tropicibacter oceani]|uniref:LysR substrate-binding domain-containing protein n=1 Tax=Tropicibacter oceani TaxID=3058420 RepID=A0ABY8QFA0_9RHOB|nr:LysR substrate-binding domain-containing protein [Tropicibacter oceani]WGW02716.1 LysR substrate-binding domain-containing protein [Tropicibacter oceani]